MTLSRRTLLGAGLASLFASPASAERIDHRIITRLPMRTTRRRTLDPRFKRRMVAAPDGLRPGDILIDTASRYLYLGLDDGTAMRYGVGVGRSGFEWSGTARIRRKAKWPGWRPPAEMRARQPGLPLYMEGGINNPLGARALYLYQGRRDTLYRIHGTNEPWTIGKAMSSGCIRMLNDDVTDLYERTRMGAKVTVV